MTFLISTDTKVTSIEPFLFYKTMNVSKLLKKFYYSTLENLSYKWGTWSQYHHHSLGTEAHMETLHGFIKYQSEIT